MDQANFPRHCWFRVRTALASAFLLMGLLPVSPVWAARQCEDGSPAGAGNVCPESPRPATPQRAAQFVSQSVPTTMVVGQSYSASVTMKNTGLATWVASNAFNLGSQNPGDNTTWGIQRVAVPGSVAANASVTFSFAVKAPLSAGTYNYQWRMVQDGVAWFGNLTTNQSITVQPSDINGTIDGVSGIGILGWACSTRLDTSIDVHLYLGGPAGSGTMAGSFRADAGSESAVASACLANGSRYRFSIPISEEMILQHGGKAIYVHGISPVSAPNSIIAGSGNFHIPQIDRNSAFVSQSVPTSMTVGQSYPVELNFRNTGNVTWKKASKYVLGSFNPADNGTWGTGRVELPNDVAPGQSVRIAFIATPQATGALSFQWKLLQEGVAWFGASSTNQVVNVEPVNQAPHVSITAPADGAVLDAPANVILRADAADPEGGLESVAFYSNDAWVGTVTSAPYQIALDGLTVGNYRLKAIARDIKGSSTASGQISVAVKEPQGPAAVARTYVYDQHHQLCKVIEPETGATVMDYDPAGNLLWSAAGLSLPSASNCDREAAYSSGRRVDRSYDVRNALKTLRFPDSNGNQDWSYTPDGLPARVTTWNEGGASTVVNTYVYNKRRLLTGESMQQSGQAGNGLGYGYDGNAHLSSMVYPSGLTVTYAPNALGQPTQIRDGSGTVYASGLQYYPIGAVKQFTYGNGVVHTLTLNARQMPLQVRDSNVVAYEYRYDGNGNVTAIFDQQQGDGYSRVMEYDGLDRLTGAGSASFGRDHWHRYTYDVLDNLLSARLGGVRQNNYWYGADNRLNNIRNDAGATTIGLSYDVQGNLSNKNGQVYTFDYGNRLRAVKDVESYRYDAQGRRIQAIRAGAGNTLSMYGKAGQLLYEERAGKGRIEYIQFNDSLLATRTGGVVSYQHTDALGSPVATTNAAGQVAERTQYEPYGAAIGKVVDGVGYAGHLMDGPTGLTYMQQRYYDPMIGRFLSVDPVAAYDKPITNFNRYAYAVNNPYVFADRDGRDGIPVVFPDYKITIGPVKVPGLGHAGVLLINNKNGQTKYYEYGRYDKAGKGIVRNLPVSNVTMGKDGKPTSESLQKVLGQISDKAGHGGAVEGAYVKNDNFNAMQSYAEGRMAKNTDSSRDSYSITSNNCATFATGVVNSGDSSFKSSSVIPTNAVDDWQQGREKVNYEPPEKKD
jgi:RHS repeat-associated protein